ncbi:MAG: hypothetical protein ISR64_03495 [Deltaproteobacteria bacterium]|nr:hypothetical protein [Deltaproteobacteria bacterium]
MNFKNTLLGIGFVSVLVAVGCGGGDDDTDTGPADVPETVDTVGDIPIDTPLDVEPPLPPLPTKAPLATPADPLIDTDIESCALYQEERCLSGKLQQCQVYDTVGEAWVDTPETLLHRTLLFDRWRDLYNSPDGQAIDRDFSVEVLPGTPESEWGNPENFAGYWGAGDGGIWTGWSVVAAILRYSQTGTDADYERMEQHVRDMVTMYDVTGVPGYVCRYHYLMLPEGAPNTPDHILRWENQHNLSHHDRLLADPENTPNLPDIYTDGITDEAGKVWKGTPMWHGRPSIDQNTGPMTSLPMAWDLLKDEALKDRIVHHLTCYLKRLQRIELTNLQQNQDLLNGLMAYFSVGELQLDPEDIDLTRLDTIVGYVNRQINTINEDQDIWSCPDTVQMEPWRVIDATSDTFLVELIELVMDMDTEDGRENQIDHYYFPSIRGGDAMHLMHLAAMAYHFTGDDMYREFLYDELIGNIDTIGVAHTAGAFNLPKFCKKYYGDQITYGPWWAFLELLDASDLKTEMQKAFHNEMWDKLVKVAGNTDFAIMYAGALPKDIAKDRQQALAFAMDNILWMGGNGGTLMDDPFDPKWLDDPRRSYTLTPDQVLAATPDGIMAVCPTDDELAICTAEIDIMGITMDNLTGWDSQDCPNGPGPWECDIGNEVCTDQMASGPLPIPLRRYTDFLWQRNPFELGRDAGVEGHRQFAGSDVSEPYWNARRYGFITEGQGQVLAWKETGDCTD